MATLVLSAVGAAVGANFGGAVLGLSGMVIGRAVGATVGRLIDQQLMGLGSDAVDHGRIERLRLTGAGEGVALPRVWGRMRVAGHVIWASGFTEIPGAVSGGKFGPPLREAARYTVSVALALCEGPITGLGRVWANGEEVSPQVLNLRVYRGTGDQLPDPAITAIEGVAPAYRGTAYVVLEDLDLGPFGNRMPQLSFEVLRAAQSAEITLQDAVRAVAWMPGSGEFALAAEPVLAGSPAVAVNVNSPSNRADFATALDALQAELPNVGSGLLVVSWFGDDLRCGSCSLRPMVDSADRMDGAVPWRVTGLTRASAQVVPVVDGAAVYGGTPADASVLSAIAAMRAAGQSVVFYPFILMTQGAGNGRPDPWSGADDQPVLPWRGRITLSVAPGRDGSPDRSAAAADQVAGFFGTVTPAQFTVTPGQVVYSGPDEWSYRRFILHYAALCAAAGGVDAFCIGSEMRGLTMIRGAGDSFPAVAQLRALLADVRAILGPDCRLTYAADWSEYAGFGDDHGNRYFHLDPLWADDDCDAIGIDNYMPLSDWRAGEDHLDAALAPAIHDLAYLRGQIAGGEGFDWFYPDWPARRAQARVPITDGAHGKPWVFRTKDLRAWWENPHFDRAGGVELADPTPWVARSKPVWFTELGCPAVDKGTNQPNVFFDAKSSESALPWHSDGSRDDLIQMQYLRAMALHWTDPAQNPLSDVYGGPMVDWTRAHVWAWDARPFPWFPGNADLWSDAPNWARGHWLTGRAMNQPLAAVVAEICDRAGVPAYDVSGLRGLVRGYAVPSSQPPRAQLQPLMLAHGFEAVEQGGVLRFQMRTGRVQAVLDPAGLVARQGGDLEQVRAAAPETSGRVRLTHVAAEGDFETRSAEAVFPQDHGGAVRESELPLALTRGEARRTAARWLAEARVARDVARFALPPSARLGAGDVVALAGGHWRIDRVEMTGGLDIEAVRIEPGVYRASASDDDPVPPRVHQPPAPVVPVFLDLPLMRGDEVPHAPHLAVTARPWPGAVAVFDGPAAGGALGLNTTLAARAAIGALAAPLPAQRPGLFTHGAEMMLSLPEGVALATVPEAAVLDGANLLALEAGSDWELIQYGTAALVAPGLWRLTRLLRGQFGTEPLIAPMRDPGARVVLIDRALAQVTLAQALRGVPRRWRIGPAARPFDDLTYVETVEAFRGVGLRPYAPVHLRAGALAGGDMGFTWTRRSRSGGDDWSGFDVPLAEEVERYLVQVRAGGVLRREVVLGEPGWIYPAAQQAADGVEDGYTLSVAQVSALFGPGLAAALDLDGGAP